MLNKIQQIVYDYFKLIHSLFAHLLFKLLQISLLRLNVIKIVKINSSIDTWIYKENLVLIIELVLMVGGYLDVWGGEGS